MAEKTLKFRAELEDKVTGGLKNIEGGLKGFAGRVNQHHKAIGMGMTAMGGVIVGALTFATKSAIEQEEGIRRLDASLRTLGTSYDAQKEKIEAAASALQDKTNYGDEASREAISRLVAITGDLNLSLEGLEAASDLAAVKGMKLEKAAQLVGRALSGEAMSLAMFIPEIDNTASATEVLNLVQQKYGLQAEASRKATASLMARLEDLSQSIAQALVPNAENLAEALEDIVKKVNAWVDDNQVLVGWLVKWGAALGAIMLVLGPLLIALPTLVTIIKGASIAFIALNASMGPIGLIAMAIAAALVALSANTETLTAIINIAKQAIGFVVKIYLAYIDAILLAVQATAKFFGVKGVEKWAKDMREKIDGVSKSVDNWSKSSSKAAREVARTQDGVLDKHQQWLRIIRRENEKHRADEAAAQRQALQDYEDRVKREADMAAHLVEIKVSNKKYEIQQAKEAFAVLKAEGDKARQAERDAVEETKRIREENIRSMMAETDKILAERAKREADHDASLDRLRENLDETNIAWRESGKSMEDIIRRWADATGSEIEDVLTHFDKHNIQVDNVKEVLSEFTKATGEDFLSWAGSVDTATTVAKDTLAGVADVAAEVGGSIRSSLDISNIMRGGVDTIKTGQSIREQFGFGTAETNWFRQQIDEHFRLQAGAGGILGEGSRVDLGEQLLKQAIKQGDDRTIAIAEAGMELEKTALAEKQAKRLADEEAKAKAQADKEANKVDGPTPATLAMRARIADIEGGYANGGITKGGIALVGERGPELVSLPSGSRVHPNGSVGGSMNFHFHGAVYGVEDLKRVVVEAVRDHAISGGFTGVFAEA